ncbi:efflux RND transporter periplasmic adaptor subunit [Candidatus Methylocalor cossyra]|uniref:Multidrug efflux system membrane fusion protein n=1 Tax=Candidatus Methylocalor cossyra TaxID=3108543 RepID=A0ABM9NKX9_9GAMM
MPLDTLAAPQPLTGHPDPRQFIRRQVDAHLPKILLALFLLGLLGCESSAQKAPVAPPPMPVKIAQPIYQEVVQWDEYPARIEAVESVDVRARVDGYLEKVNFKAGDKVKKGDLLFVIDPRPFRAQLSFAEASLEQAKVRLALARNNWARAERMLKAKAIAEEEYDARSKGLAEAEAAVRSAEANVYAARLNLEFTQVRAPISGRIGRELITAGNLVKGGGADATLLTFIVSTDPVYVYVDVDERAALKYRRLTRSGCFARRNDSPSGCTPVDLALADETGFPHQGYIDYESPRLDPGTGTLTLRAVFPNPDGLLSPGLFTRLRLPGSAPFQAVLLPDRAIATDLAQKFVWVMNGEQQVERRRIVPGPVIDGLRVVSEGLAPSDWVVVEGIQKLRPGAKVVPERITVSELAKH